MSSTPLAFRIMNPVMIALLRSPVHGMLSSTIMVISFKGRVSGKTYSIPVSYYRAGDQVYCFTHAKWWRNMTDSAQVELLVRGGKMTGQAVAVVEDEERKAAILGQMLAVNKMDARFYAVTFDVDGNQNKDEVTAATEQAVMIEINVEGK